MKIDHVVTFSLLLSGSIVLFDPEAMSAIPGYGGYVLGRSRSVFVRLFVVFLNAMLPGKV